jgi:chalcone isomerase-like protein
LFRTMRRGETIFIDLLPNGDTRVTINSEARGVVTGAEFQRALLKVWLGDKPADSDLKRAMLGAK